MKRYHVVRLTRSVTRGRWGIARSFDQWTDGTLSLVLEPDEQHFYSESSAAARVTELERLAKGTTSS